MIHLCSVMTMSQVMSLGCAVLLALAFSHWAIAEAFYRQGRADEKAALTAKPPVPEGDLG